MLQLEHKEWIDKKYPNQSPKYPAVGCLEEAGELVHAILKIEQVRTWGEDTRHNLVDLRVKLVDAIGDCGIFACSLCNATGDSFYYFWHEAKNIKYSSNKDSLDAAILLSRVAADLALDPNDPQLLFKYLCQLIDVAYLLGLDAEIAIKTTWLKVKER